MEHNLLSGGLEMVELAKDVYTRRVAELDARRRNLSDTLHVSQVSDCKRICA